jgi:hypothetical protein
VTEANRQADILGVSVDSRVTDGDASSTPPPMAVGGMPDHLRSVSRQGKRQGSLSLRLCVAKLNLVTGTTEVRNIDDGSGKGIEIHSLSGNRNARHRKCVGMVSREDPGDENVYDPSRNGCRRVCRLSRESSSCHVPCTKKSAGFES